MGATNCPETPRQKMIQMMYLVYTAMLALNVSAEVLAGFVTVGDAMDKSNISLQSKLQDSYNDFERAYANNPAKTKEAWEKAQEVRAISQDLEQYIDSIQCDFLCALQSKVDIKIYDSNGVAQKVVIPLQDEQKNHFVDSARNAIKRYGLSVIDKPDNNHDGTHFFLGSSPETLTLETEVPAIIIRNRIVEYKKKIRSIMGDDGEKIKMALNVEEKMWSDHAKDWVSWEIMNFDNTIAIADMVVLSRLKAEVMTAEYDAVNLLYEKINEDDFKFDQITYVTKPVGGSGYVMQGGKYETEVRIAAYDSKTPFRVQSNGTMKTSDRDGVVVLSGGTQHIGENTIRGSIYVKGDDGKDAKYDFEEKYYVAAPSAVIELTNMNVIYAGIDNPVTISVPGVNNPKINIVIKEGNATFTPKGNGEYTVTAKLEAKGKTSVSFDVNVMIDGVMKTMGHGTFRIKPMPTPQLVVGNKKGGPVTIQELNSYGLRAQYDENFTFKLPKEKQPKIKNYEITFGKSNDPITGSGNIMNNTEFKDRLAKARNGEKIFIDAMVDCNDGKGPKPVPASFRIKK